MAKPVLLRLPESLVDMLDQEAQRLGQSRNKTAEHLLRDALYGLTPARTVARELIAKVAATLGE